MRKTGRDSGNGQFLPIAKAKAMGERATVETLASDEISQAMIKAGFDALARSSVSGAETVQEVYRAMRAARPR